MKNKKAEKRSPSPKLTVKQKQFCLEYLIDKHGTNAAIRAGYSAKNAEVQASCLLRIAKVKDEIVKQIHSQEDRTLIKADDVVRELMKIAMMDVRGAFTEQGMMKDLTDIPDDLAHAISQIEVNELYEGTGEEKEKIGYTKKVKMNDKVRALELLGRHLKMFTDKTEITGKDGGPIETTSPRERLASQISGIAAKLGAVKDPRKSK